MEEQVKARLIVESSLRYATLYFYIPKKKQISTASIRLQKVELAYNEEQDIIREVTNKLKNIKYFNKLYLIWEYNNIQIKEEDKWKVAVVATTYHKGQMISLTSKPQRRSIIW